MTQHDRMFGTGLPYAPLAMPKQRLERRRSLFGALKAVFATFPRPAN